MTTVLLESPGLTALDVSLANGYIITRLDLGDAETRVVSDEAPDADGTDDETTFTGARVITMAVRLIPRGGFVPAVLEQRLRAFTHPRLRPVMTVTRDGIASQRAVLRRGPFQAPIEQATHEDVTVQWVAPNGLLESSDLHSQLVYASDPTPAGGRTYALTFPRVYPAALPTGIAIINNAGNATAYPLLRLYGPCTEPIIESLTQDKLLEFDSLTINAGEFLEIDIRAKTILLNGDPTDSVYDKLLYPSSDWWTLSPGNNEIKYRPLTFTASTTVAEVVWRDAFL